MKKSLILTVVLGLAGLVFAGCSKKEEAQQKPMSAADSVKVEQAAAVYACPMHPEVTSDKPGKCSKCGMDLVEATAK